ncbi:MAG: hypothetical protein KBA86_01185 [Bacteroidales bacterium]|nr:hypothetical protein [Bacteroidales bacterium]
MRYKNIFWGIFFITIGVLWLLHNQQLIYIDWRNLWHLWPFILVLMGISIIPVKDIYKIIMDVIVMGIAIFVMLTPFNQNEINKQIPFSKLINVDHKDSTHFHTASLSLEAGTGTLIFAPGNSLIQVFGLNGQAYDLKITKKKKNNFSHAKIDLEIYPFKQLSKQSEAVIQLDTVPVWDLDFDLGISKSKIDLTNFKIKELDLDAGISDVELRLGSLYSNVKVEVSTGVSSVKIEVPYSMGCNIHNESALGNYQFVDFENQGDGYYTSSNPQDSLIGHIDIYIETGVSNVTVIRY